MEKPHQKKKLGFIFPLLILAFILYIILTRMPSEKYPDKKEFIYYSFEDFNTLIGSNDKLTLSQVQSLFNSYKGKYVNWVGEIEKIKKNTSGDLVIYFKHFPKANEYDVRVVLAESNKDKAKKIKKGYLIPYSGRLESYNPVQGYFLVDGDIAN